ncbi:MAG: alpha/beta hydrolase, partial [Solirubrobacteraceae bacterium]
DVPSDWNGTLLLYSHGYGTLSPQDAPDPNTQAALLTDGYALAGSGYDPNGSLWALGSAVRDQFQTLQAVKRTVLPSRPSQVLAFGTSMGGLISALEDQQSNGRLDGALTTCGLVAGGIQLNNYQLDGEYAIDKLLAADAAKLVNYTSPGDAVTAAVTLNNAAGQAQTSPEGRARLALAMALMNVTTWAPNEAMPGVYDYATQEQEQYDEEFVANPVMIFVETGRQQIELAAGGNGGWDVGVNFAKLLSHSSYYAEVHALYQAAGLSLRDDLTTLTRGADIRASDKAIRWLQQTSVPTGHLQVPELDLHTISDQLVPVQQENYYHRVVRRAGDRELVRQAFVARQEHCNFTPGELVAGVQALQHRVSTGSWDSVTLPSSLETPATALNLGPAAFTTFWPDRLSGDNGPFNPFTEGTRG